MSELSDGMARLIGPWTLTVTVDNHDRQQHFPPLVDMLNGQLAPGMEGGSGGGLPSTRNILDVQSLDLLIHIQDVTRAWLQEWGVQGAGELKLDLRGFWERLNTLHNTGAMDDTTFEHLASYPDTWAAKVWDLIEPPKTVPLRRTECPKCGEGKVTNGEGESTDNLIITFRVGHEFTAECRNRECAAVWIGVKGLQDLGRSIGVEIDIDTLQEAVAQMG